LTVMLTFFCISLLLRRECCTFSNGEYVKAGLSLLEKWITDVTEEVSANSAFCLSGRYTIQECTMRNPDNVVQLV
jgi:hypothetical protein